MGWPCRVGDAFVAGGENIVVLFKLQALNVATDESSKRSLITIPHEDESTIRFISKVPAVDWRNFPNFSYILFLMENISAKISVKFSVRPCINFNCF